jgi:hypothetical protein
MNYHFPTYNQLFLVEEDSIIRYKWIYGDGISTMGYEELKIRKDYVIDISPSAVFDISLYVKLNIYSTSYGNDGVYNEYIEVDEFLIGYIEIYIGELSKIKIKFIDNKISKYIK